MFKWYFQFYYVENGLLFWFSTALIILIIILTIYFVRKALRENNASK